MRGVRGDDVSITAYGYDTPMRSPALSSAFAMSLGQVKAHPAVLLSVSSVQ